MAEVKPKKKRSPSVPKPVYVLYKGDNTEIVEVVRKPEDVLAVIDNDPNVNYVKADVK